MQFKIITPEILKSCLSNLLMNNYSKPYNQFCESVNLEITEEQFEEFKVRKISFEEINQIISQTKINEIEEVKRLEMIWKEKEKEIISTMNKLSKLNISTENITCYVDPYQKGGYYGEDNITVGNYRNPEDVLFVIAHELFHIFYWRKLIKLNITKSTMGNESPMEWEIAETTVHLIATEQKMREFWKNIEIEIYPEIKEMYGKLKNIWEENSFEDYLTQAYLLLKNDSK